MNSYSSPEPPKTSSPKAGGAGCALGSKGMLGNGATAERPALDYDPALWRLDSQTQAALQAVWIGFGGEADSTLNEFYRFMGTFPESAPHIADKGRIDCLKLLLKEHWQSFFKGTFDEVYLNRVHGTGVAHARVLLPQKFIVAAYSFFLERMVASVLRQQRRRPADAQAQISALIRATMMEMFLSTDVSAKTAHAETMLNGMQELAESFEHELDQAVEFVRRSATGMETAADTVLAATGRVAEDAELASEASEQANANAQAIAAAAEEMSASIAEISRQVEQSSMAAQDASVQSRGARSYAENLAAVSERIGSIVKLIERISKETRLLALNANIEAARAGDAGRGFAVVANEVKNLADQTNRATGEIRSEIEAMQTVIRNTVIAIGDVAGKVEVATNNISGIAGAITEQEAVTREIAQSAGNTAESIHTVHSKIASVATDANDSRRETTQLRQDTHSVVDQVIGIKRRVIATLRNTRFADRRHESRQAVDAAATCTVNGRAWSCRTDNLSMAGAQVRAPDLAATITMERTPVAIDITEIGRFEGVIVAAETDVVHVNFTNVDGAAARRLGEVVDRCKREDAEMIVLAKESAAKVGRLFEEAIERKEITWDALWDVDYRIIKDSDPPQYTTKFLALCDRILPSIQEHVLVNNTKIVFSATVDRNGYLPTHNNKYSLAQRPGDKAWNTANCRNRRIFDDRTGLAAARSRQAVLVQIYRRDMGGGQFVSMKDISAPVMVHGQHWGGYRIGCRF